MMDINQKINEIAVQYFDGNNVKFAERMGTSEANIRNYRTKSAPKVDFLVKLRKELEISFDWLLVDEGSMNHTPLVAETAEEFLLRTDRKLEHQMIPLYEFQAAAGLISVFGNHKNVLDFIVIPNLPKCDGAISITGDSMYPLLKAGDIVAYKQIHDIKEGIRFGEMHILSVMIDGDLATVVKYVQVSDKGEEYIKLVSQNSHHADRHVKLNKVKAIALVKASIRIN